MDYTLNIGGTWSRRYIFDPSLPTWEQPAPKEQRIRHTLGSKGLDRISPNPYTLQVSKVIHPYGRIACPGLYEDSGCLHWTSPIGVPSIADFDDDSLYNKSLNKVVDALKGRDDSGHDLLVSAFESPELKSLYKQLKENLSYLKGNKFLKVLRKSSPLILASEYYLLWTFGIAPLIGAMEEILKTLEKGLSINEKIKGSSYISDSIDNLVALPSYDREYNYECFFTKRYIIGCDVGIEDINALIRSQFGLNTPGSAYYATLPMSFVLDWFIDIGGYLNTLESLASFTGYKINNVYQTEVTRYIATNTAKGMFRQTVGDRTWFDLDITSQRHSFTMERKVLGSTLPSPRLPSFKPRLNGGKITSLFALATQLLHMK